jgi:hypothetical protein
MGHPLTVDFVVSSEYRQIRSTNYWGHTEQFSYSYWREMCIKQYNNIEGQYGV